MADTKLTALTADTTPTSDDLTYVVNDPAGTPGSKKVTLGNAITKAHGLSDGSVVSVVSGVMDSTAVTSSAAELNILDGATLSTTELNYVDGVTSAIQTQLNAKQPLDSDLTTIAGLTIGNGDFLQVKSGAWTNRSGTQVTADLNVVIGDSGSGGTKGLVPAPAAGDAAASKFLKADGTWAAPSGSGDFSSNTSTSVDGEVVLFSGTGGKTGKRATGSGIAKLTSGVLGTGTAGTDYTSPSGTENLTNKTLDGTNTITAKDSTFSIADDGDATKKIAFQASGITTGTTRTLTAQDASGTIYITGGTDVSVADGGTGASTLTANNVILGNGTSAVQFVAPGTTGNVLTSNGTTWTSAAAIGGSAIPPYIYSTNFEAEGRYSKFTGAAGSTTISDSAYRIDTGATSSGYVSLKDRTSSGINLMGGNSYMSVICKSTGDAPTTGIFFAGPGKMLAGGSDIDLTTAHYGFKRLTASSTRTWYATNGNESNDASTSTSFTPDNADDYNLLGAQKNSTTNVKYYCNQTLVATQTTNLPVHDGSTFMSPLNVAVSNKGTATTNTIDLLSYSFSKDMY